MKVLEEMWAVDTYKSRDLRRMVKGLFDATVEVEGTITCDEPLTSLAAGVPCCYFKTTVLVQKKEIRKVQESGHLGKLKTKTETEYKWIPETAEEGWAVFKVNDGTGYTLVDPRKAKIDTESVHAADLTQRLPWFEKRIGISDTGRYRIEERALLPEGYVYVLGQASEQEEAPLIHLPDKGYMDLKKKVFLISRKSEQQLTKKRGKTVRTLLWIAALFFLASAILLLLYIT